LSKLPVSAKLGLLVGALVIALAAGWFVVIAPKRSEAAKLQDRIDDTRAQVVVRQRGSSQPQKQAPAIRVADLFELSRAMPNRADMPGMLLQLSHVAAETGVMFESITPHDPVPLGSYQKIAIDLVFEGHFYDLSDFLYRLRNLVGVHDGVLEATGRLFSVDSISLDEGKLQFPQVKAILTVSAYIFGDGTAAPLPLEATSAGQPTATTTTPATPDSQPIPAAPPGATAAGA
jgi:Tfp pilus assembly protein PilO